MQSMRDQRRQVEGVLKIRVRGCIYRRYLWLTHRTVSEMRCMLCTSVVAKNAVDFTSATWRTSGEACVAPTRNVTRSRDK